MMSEPLARGPASQAETLRVGTWNMSHWSVAKLAFLASSGIADVLALQETHLAPLPLERHMYLLAWLVCICTMAGRQSLCHIQSMGVHVG